MENRGLTLMKEVWCRAVVGGIREHVDWLALVLAGGVFAEHYQIRDSQTTMPPSKVGETGKGEACY